MDKKIDLDAQRGETTKINIRPNASNTITFQAKVPILNTNHKPGMDNKIITNEKRITRLQQTTTNQSYDSEEDDYNDEELDDDYDEDDSESEDDDIDNETDEDSQQDDGQEDNQNKNKDKDSKKEKKQNQQQSSGKKDLDAKQMPKDPAKAAGKGAKSTPAAGGSGAAASGSGAAAGGSGAAAGGSAAAASSGAAAGGSAAAASSGAAASGGVASAIATAGFYVLIAFLIILFISFLAAVIIVLFGGKASTLALVNKHGNTCHIVTVYDTENEGQYDGDVDYETYIAGVVAAEVGDRTNLEYLKVEAILARTYAQQHLDGSCKIAGNSTQQTYIDVNASANPEIIKKAVEETSRIVLEKNDKLIQPYYSDACVVGQDNDNYYVRYGTFNGTEPAKIQVISKSWDRANGNELKNWHAQNSNSSDSDYMNNQCANNNDYGLSRVGAYYLITEELKNHREVLKYYYGNNIKLESNDEMLDGYNEFVNPLKKIYCTSPYGYRTRNNKIEYHDALDLGGNPEGTPIFAAQAGEIIEIEKDVTEKGDSSKGYGNYIKIKHEDGTTTLYAHMKHGSIREQLEKGYKVFRGEQIGQVGATGNTDGVHLHYEVTSPWGFKKDPAKDYMDITHATGDCGQ